MRLLEEINEAYYWIGFILADGCYNHDKKRLRLQISSKDKNHFVKYTKFINKPIKKCKQWDTVYADIYRPHSNQIAKKFDIKQRKTYDPPKIDLNYSKDLLLSMFVGLVDGDGHIKNQFNRPDFIISIQTHSSWIPFFIKLNNKLCDIYNIKLSKPYILNRGYLRYNICHIHTLQQIKKDLLKLNIPYMKRKWDIIDINYQTKENKAIKKYNDIKTLKKNHTTKEISKILNIPINTINYYLYQSKYAKAGIV